MSSSGTGNLPNGDSLYIGYLEVCINGTYEPLCRDAVDMDVIEVACYNLFGPGHSEIGLGGARYSEIISSLFYYYTVAYPYPVIGSPDDYSFDLPSSDTGAYDIDCSYNQYSMYGSCDPNSLEFTTMDGCDPYGGYPVVTCRE